MANQLGMAEQQSILVLARRGWSQRRIARALGIHRETVARYIALSQAGAACAGAGPPLGGASDDQKGRSGAADPSKPAISITGSDPCVGDAPAGEPDPRGGDPSIGPGVSAVGPDPSKPAISITGSDPCVGDAPAGEPDTRGGDPSIGPGVSAVGPDPSKPAISITGSDGRGEAKPAHSMTGSAGRQSHCVPHQEVILAKLEQGLSAQRIWQDLVEDHRFADGYQSVQRFVRRLRTRTPMPFRRLETPPGEEAQIDFGVGAPVIIPEGEVLPVGVKTRRRKTHVFRIVLSCSRKAYSEAVYRQTTDDFLRCLENAFHHFGGVPRVLVIDNLKAGVLKADWYDPDLNPKLAAFAEHYGTVILPTRPRMPRHKGKIENQIGYVKNNALKGRSFPSLAAENEHLLAWETHVADTRIHGTTKQQISKVFEQIERPALRPKADTHHPVLIKAFVERIELWCGQERIAVHPRSYDKGQYLLEPEHYLMLLRTKPGCLDNARAFKGQPWGEDFVVLRRELEYRYDDQGTRKFIDVLLLFAQYPEDDVKQAVGLCVRRRAFRDEAVLGVLRNEPVRPSGRLDLSDRSELMNVDEGIRSASVYDQLLSREEVAA